MDALQLTSEQRQAVENGEAVTVLIDRLRCFIIRGDVFERVHDLLSDDEELRAIFARGIESSDWNDPAMDVYDNYVQP